MRRVAALLTLTVLSAAPLVAQTPNAPSTRLAHVASVTCSFPVLTTGTWTGGAPEAAIKTATLSVGFNAVDAQEGTAEAVGDAGKYHITVRLLGSYLHFMQLDPYGALYITTVFDKETRGGRLQAVHTRHEYTPVSLPGLTSRPEQYFGDCAVKD